jgi:hypothetical protein
MKVSQLCITFWAIRVANNVVVIDSSLSFEIGAGWTINSGSCIYILGFLWAVQMSVSYEDCKVKISP